MNREFDLTITHYSKKGHGTAPLMRQENQPPVKVEVVGSVIGDHLKISLGKRKKGAYRGELLEILCSSKKRVDPRCPSAGICGGCSWQQLSYEAQLEEKQEKVAAPFKPFLNEATLHPIVPCENPWHYRNKMEFSFSENKGGEKFLGLIMTGSRGKVLTLKECHLTESWFLKALESALTWWEESDLHAFHPPSGRGTLRTLTLREGKRTGEKMIFLTVSGDHDHFLNRTDLNTFKKAMHRALPGENPSLFLRIHHAEKGRPTAFYEMHLEGPAALHEKLHVGSRVYDFHISPASFFQPNTLQAEKLFEHALKIAKPTKTMRVYDLYAGCAVLGTIFAPYVKKVVSIELCSYAACDAETNIEANNLTNLQMMQGDVGKVLSEFQLSADLAIVDPPRSGLDGEAIKHLLRLSPQKILFISCNPVTQAENIFELTKEGYSLLEIQPVDQFPHTPHIENICFLEKNG